MSSLVLNRFSRNVGKTALAGRPSFRKSRKNFQIFSWQQRCYMERNDGDGKGCCPGGGSQLFDRFGCDRESENQNSDCARDTGKSPCRRKKTRLTPQRSFGPEADGVLCTRSADGCFLNLIFLNPPAGETVRLPGIALPPVRAELLNTGEAVTATLEPMVYSMSAPPALRLRHLPVERMYDEIQVVRLTYPEPFRKTRTAEKAEPCLL